MAKTDYLELTNKVLRRINQAEVTDVTALTGHSLIISNYINECQIELYNETNWYSLYATRDFSTVAGTAEYAVASDYGRTLDLIDMTNNRVLVEDFTRNFDESDPDEDTQGTPTHFTIQGSNYRLYPIPAGINSMRDRYFKQPVTLAANTDTSDLPIECENLLISYASWNTLNYLNLHDRADREQINYEKKLKKARIANTRKLDHLIKFSGLNDTRFPLIPAQFPSNYGRYNR